MTVVGIETQCRNTPGEEDFHLGGNAVPLPHRRPPVSQACRAVIETST